MMRQGIFVFVLFVLLAGFVYIPSFQSPFLVDDDQSITHQVKYYQQDPWRLIKHFWSLEQTSALAARPVTTFTLWFNYKIGEVKPFIYKITNVFLHALAAFVVFILIRYLCQLHFPSGVGFVPWGGALIFLLHPIHTQALNIIVQRSIILMTIFGVLSFYSYLRFFYDQKNYFWVLSVVFLLLSIFSKAPGISFILVIILYGFVFVSSSQRTRYLKYASVFLLFLGVLWYLYQNNFHPQHSSLNPIEYLVVETRAVWLYWKLFLIPQPLQFLYHFSIDPGVLRNLTWLAIIGHIGVIGGTLYILRWEKYKLSSFCILCSYLSILPESSFFPMTNPVIEYRTYASFIFLSFAVVLFLFQSNLKRNVLYIAIGMILILEGIGTFHRNSQINTIEKWHYDIVSSYQELDTMNFYTLNVLAQAGDIKKVSELLVILSQKRADEPVYDFLKNLALQGPKQFLEDNLVMIESNYPSMKLSSVMLTPFFLNVAHSIIAQEYPDQQKDIICHQIFFYHIFYMRGNGYLAYELQQRYKGILQRLRLSYDQKSLLNSIEEMEKEKVRLALTIFRAPKYLSDQQVLEKIFIKYPNWQMFSDQISQSN